MFFDNNAQFMADLRADIKSLVNTADRREMRPAVRLNGTSDIDWVATGIVDEFPGVQFYDYTAVIDRLINYHRKPKNYHLTFSRKTDNDKECCRALAMGFNVAVVFDKVPVGWKFMGHTVIDGDLSDLRFLDTKRRRQPVIVGLKAKGRARHATSEFVVHKAA